MEAVRSLYAVDESEPDRLPLSIRAALGDEIHSSGLPGESPVARKAFLSSIAAKLKSDPSAKKQWSDWVKNNFKVPAERNDAILNVFKLTLELEDKFALSEALGMEVTQQSMAEEEPAEELRRLVKREPSESSEDIPDPLADLPPLHSRRDNSPVIERQIRIRDEKELLAFLTADSY